MRLLTLVYIINAVLLLLHEIESAYAKEWEILKLPGRITFFLLLHIPIIFVLFIGLLEVEKLTWWGALIAILAGIGGSVPFLVHKVIVRREGYFDSTISNSIIYLNLLTGLITVIIAAGLIKC